MADPSARRYRPEEAARDIANAQAMSWWWEVAAAGGCHGGIPEANSKHRCNRPYRKQPAFVPLIIRMVAACDPTQRGDGLADPALRAGVASGDHAHDQRHGRRLLAVRPVTPVLEVLLPQLLPGSLSYTATPSTATRTPGRAPSSTSARYPLAAYMYFWQVVNA
eukprot:SM000040S14839  [mRNA]  locus=s40:628523:629560:+ [translate_table: standard]